MNPSHMPVQHFIAQLDRWKEKRQQRDLRPEWLQTLIDELADLFNPAEEVARAGFDCLLTAQGWEVGLFLSRVEIVGGRFDGKAELCQFSYDLQSLRQKFKEISEFQLTSLPPEDEEEAVSLIVIRGIVNDSEVLLRIFSIPPQEAGIGLRRHLDGKCETT